MGQAGHRRAAFMHPVAVVPAAHVLAAGYDLPAAGADCPRGLGLMALDGQPRAARGVRIISAGLGPVPPR